MTLSHSGPQCLIGVVNISQCSRWRCPDHANLCGCAFSLRVESPAPGAQTEPGGRGRGRVLALRRSVAAKAPLCPGKPHSLVCDPPVGFPWVPLRSITAEPGKAGPERCRVQLQARWPCLRLVGTAEPVPLCLTWDLRTK